MLEVAKDVASVLGWMFAVAAAVVTIAAWLQPKSGERLMARVRHDATYDWQSVLPRIAAAKTRVLLLQTWFPSLQIDPWRKALSRGGIQFRVLLADQKLVEYRLRSREPVSSYLMQNVSQIRHLAQELRDRDESPPEVRFYKSLPFGPIYVIDEDVYFGLYLSHMDSMHGPVFHARADTRLGTDIISSFQAAWEEASDRTGLLSVAENLDRHSKNHTEEEVEIFRRSAVTSSKVKKIGVPRPDLLNNLGGFLCILRHAETDLNEADIITGGLDVGINFVGREHIRTYRSVFQHESWAEVYSSPARRCTETLTELLTDAGDVLIRDEFRGRSMGELEGYAKLTYQSSVPRYKDQDILAAFHASPDDGEAYCDVFYRLSAFVEEIVEGVLRGRRILICTHDTVIRMLVLILENIPIEEVTGLEVRSGEPIYYAPRT